MGWWWPKDFFDNGYVMDSESVREALFEVAALSSGGLGEQNWSANLVVADRCTADYLLRLHHSYTEVNWTALNPLFEPVSAPANSVRVSNDAQWFTVETFQVTIRASRVYVVWSFQLDRGNRTDTANYWTHIEGAQWAIRVDGQVFEECIHGSVDKTRDPHGEGVAWDIAPLVVDAVVEVTPGVHTIDLVARTCRNADFDEISVDLFNEVFSREHAFIEMW